MKKIFSAFLLMTMMVASVGSFVSCSDIEESIAAVDEATKDNAASIKDLESKIAALQTALQTAQSEAAAAKAEANAAKQAAATAKAEAIAAALAEIEKVNGDVDAVNAEIKKINDALAGCATKEAVELLGTIETLPTESGELDDDALDAVAGGCTYKDGYAVVTMNVKCFAPGKPYAQDPYPTHPGTLKGARCGTCIHCQTRQGMEICTLIRKPEITNR